MRAIIWNTKALPIPGTSYFHVRKFMSGFEQHGLSTAEANDPNLMDLIRDDDIVYVSNHGFDHANFALAAAEFSRLSKKGCVFILWHFHNLMNSEVFENLPVRHVFTGEDHPTSEPLYDLYRKNSRFHPTTFLSSVRPADVGLHARDPKYDAQFVGSPYQPHLMSRLAENFTIVGKYAPPFISEEERIATFLVSRCTLGFHSTGCLEKRLVTERVAEGLSYGCVVVSDNIRAPEVTDGCAIYASSYEEFADVLTRAKSDESWLKTKQSQGYEFARNKGTYTHLAGNFIRHFAKCELI